MRALAFLLVGEVFILSMSVANTKIFTLGGILYRNKTMLGIRGIIAFITLLLSPAICAAGNLTITEPKAGAVFKPGDQIVVSVSQGSPSVLFNEGLFLTSGGLTTPTGQMPVTTGPFKLLLKVPNNAKLGDYPITVMGKQSGNEAVYSASVEIMIDTAAPESLKFDLGMLYIPFVGSPVPPIDVYGGTQTIPPSLIVFTSDTPTVAIVDVNGGITGISPGNATITASYKTMKAQLPVTVGSLKVRGDFNGDGVVDASDIAFMQPMLNTNAVSSSDARDLNADGKINASDVNVLTTLCTKAQCAK